MRTSRARFSVLTAAFVFGTVAWSDISTLVAQSPRPATDVKFAQIRADEMKEWLTYLASDELQGRQVFTEGYGLAAQYVAERLRSWDVKPLGEGNSYLQPVRVRGYKATRNSSVTVEANGQTRTFKHSDHVTFPANVGGRQTLTFDSVEFVGYRQEDAATRKLEKQLVVSVPNLAPPVPGGPPAPPPPPASATSAAPQTPAATIRYAAPPTPPTAAEEALAQAQAALAQATAAVTEAQRGLRGRGAGGRGAAVPAGRGAQAPQTPDFTTVQRVDAPIVPQLTADDTFFEALFAGSGTTFADIRAKATKGEALTPLNAEGKGHDCGGSHLRGGVAAGHAQRRRHDRRDRPPSEGHLRASSAPTSTTSDTRRRVQPAIAARMVAAVAVPRHRQPSLPLGEQCSVRRRRAAVVRRQDEVPRPAPPTVAFDQRDVISNGADDDGSGSTTLLAIAKAFATGPKPKRSVVIIWHAGEENGLYGSRFNADFPAMPLDRIQTVFNLDMVGRDDCDNIEGDFSNTLFVIGADRISTDVHNVIVETNRTLPSAADARLRAQRSAGSRVRVHAQRPLQLRREGHPGGVLHDGPAP